MNVNYASHKYNNLHKYVWRRLAKQKDLHLQMNEYMYVAGL